MYCIKANKTDSYSNPAEPYPKSKANPNTIKVKMIAPQFYAEFSKRKRKKKEEKDVEEERESITNLNDLILCTQYY
jgi:hypothetical protein